MNVWKVQLITLASYAWVGVILKEVKKNIMGLLLIYSYFINLLKCIVSGFLMRSEC